MYYILFVPYAGAMECAGMDNYYIGHITNDLSHKELDPHSDDCELNYCRDCDVYHCGLIGYDTTHE